MEHSHHDETVKAVVDPQEQFVTGLVPAEIVSDRRDTFWRRLPILALFLVLMYFVIAAQVQSAQNGDSIHKLTTSQVRLTDSQAHMLRTLRRDEGYVILASQYIQAQHRALRQANKRLRAAGLRPVVLPPPPTPPQVSQQGRRAASGGGASPRPTPSPSGHSSPSPSHSPSPSTSPTPKPLVCADLPIIGEKCTPVFFIVLGAFHAVIR